MKLNFLFLLILMLSLFFSLEAQNKVIQLLKGSGPDAWKNYEETAKPNGDIHMKGVEVPALEMFIPKDGENMSCVVICPGGGYGNLSFGKEGRNVAASFNEIGVAAVVLRYRLPKERAEKGNPWIPLLDVQLALQYLNKNAKELGLKKDKIGVMGFSAGGHLAGSASTLFNHPQQKNMIKSDIRPDFSILIYPVITTDDAFTHKGSKLNLMGKTPYLDILEMFSLEKQVSNQTPPTFLLHAKDDTVVPIKNSSIYRDACVANNVKVVFYELNAGGHGFGLGSGQSGEWFHLLSDWISSFK